MRRISAGILLAGLFLTFASCKLIQTLRDADQQLTRVGELWSDVPKMDGLTSSEADMPMFVKILMRTALNNLGRLNKEGEVKTKSTGDWAVFSTAKSPAEVQSFYTNERMTSFGSWEASKKSTCLNGNEHGFNGVACVFGKVFNKREIGLLIVAAHDDQKKQTNIFFVRVETDESTTPHPSTPANSPRGEVKPLNETAPYGIESRRLPSGLNLDELLPKQVGPYTRALLEKSDQRGVTLTSIHVDGNSVYATYMGVKGAFRRV